MLERKYFVFLRSSLLVSMWKKMGWIQGWHPKILCRLCLKNKVPKNTNDLVRTNIGRWFFCGQLMLIHTHMSKVRKKKQGHGNKHNQNVAKNLVKSCGWSQIQKETYRSNLCWSKWFFWNLRPGKCSVRLPPKKWNIGNLQKMTTPLKHHTYHTIYTIETPYIPYIPKNVKLGIWYTIETNVTKTPKMTPWIQSCSPTWKDWWILPNLIPCVNSGKVVVEPTPLKNMFVKLDHFPKVRGEFPKVRGEHKRHLSCHRLDSMCHPSSRWPWILCWRYVLPTYRENRTPQIQQHARVDIHLGLTVS